MAERIDDLQCNGYRIIQDSEGFCFGMDAVLLANFAVPAVTSETRLLDLCSGTGIVPLLIAAKTECKELIGLEVQCTVDGGALGGAESPGAADDDALRGSPGYPIDGL